jgi:NCS1 family nucleobase:cation symporter-1
MYHQVLYRAGLANWPALISWVISIIVAYILWSSGTIHLFFLFVPVWLLTSVLYLSLSPIAGAGKTGNIFDEK